MGRGGELPSRLLANRTQPGISCASTADWMEVSKSAMVECEISIVVGLGLSPAVVERLYMHGEFKSLFKIRGEDRYKNRDRQQLLEAGNCYRLVVASRCLRAACLGPH